MSEKCECGHKRTSHVTPGETVTGIICYGTGCDCPGYTNDSAAKCTNCGHEQAKHSDHGEGVRWCGANVYECKCPGFTNEAAAPDDAGVGEAVEACYCGGKVHVVDGSTVCSAVRRLREMIVDPRKVRHTASYDRLAIKTLLDSLAALTPRDEPAAATDGTLCPIPTPVKYSNRGLFTADDAMFAHMFPCPTVRDDWGEYIADCINRRADPSPAVVRGIEEAWVPIRGEADLPTVRAYYVWRWRDSGHLELVPFDPLNRSHRRMFFEDFDMWMMIPPCEAMDAEIGRTGE